jgi:uncharacterized membrane protein
MPIEYIDCLTGKLKNKNLYRGDNMPFGLTLLVVISILVIFGVAHRILDRMRLSDKTALLFAAGIFIGSLMPDIRITPNISINIGGALIPITLCVYLFAKAGTSKERWRAVWASLLSGAAVYLAGRFLPHEPETMYFDPNYIYGILAGVIAYLFGRSRRSAFIAGIMGVLLGDIFQGIENTITRTPSPLRLGTGGAVDAVVLSGLLAVILAEFVGELREKLQGGTAKKRLHFEDGEFSSAMGIENKMEQKGEEEKDADEK